MARPSAPGVLAALAIGFASAVHATADEPPPSVMRAEERLLGRVVPDIPLVLADGRRVPLSGQWADKPLLIAFFYRRCTGVCTPFLQWVRDAVQDVGGLGRDYRVLALSFDDTDTVDHLRAQADALGLRQDPGWSFAIAEKDEVARIAGALDYWYRYDPSTRQYDHSALLVAVDRTRVVRALLGSPDTGTRLHELLWELRGRFIRSYPVQGQAPIRCFAFDPRSGATRYDWGLLLLILPALAAIALALTVFARAQRAAGGSKAGLGARGSG